MSKKVKLSSIIVAALFSATTLLNAAPLPAIGPVVDIKSDGYVYIGSENSSYNSTGNHPNTVYYNCVNGLVLGKGTGSPNYGQWAFEAWNGGFNISKPSPTSNWGNYKVYITDNGKVCIGSNDPHSNSKLDVRGNVYANGVLLTSDKRFKKDIKPIETNINQLSKLNSIKYKQSAEILKSKAESMEKNAPDLKDEVTNQRYQMDLGAIQCQINDIEQDTTTKYGFIAQELRELYPDLVTEDAEGYLAVNYIGMIPVLVETIKELNAKIDAIGGKDLYKTNTTVVTDGAKLYQNNPNPFSENTEIKYYLPENAANASIRIYNLVGEEIAKFDLVGSGYNSLTINGNVLKAGMYFYGLLVDGQMVDRKEMILTK